MTITNFGYYVMSAPGPNRTVFCPSSSCSLDERIVYGANFLSWLRLRAQHRVKDVFGNKDGGDNIIQLRSVNSFL